MASAPIAEALADDLSRDVAVARRKTHRGAAYAIWGEGEPLLLIHGVGMRIEAWTPQIRALSGTHRVIAVDMPGHGESDRLPKEARLPAFVAWLAGVLEELGLDRVNVAGHSMGALIAAGLAASHGPRIRRVALLNSVFRRDAAARAAVLARAEAIASGSFDAAGPLARWFGPDEQESRAYRLTRGWLRAVDVEGYATAYRAFAEGDEIYADAWPGVTCPALFLTGQGDPNSTPAMAEAMAALAPSGEACIVPGHRHMVNLTAPGLVNDALARWLSREVAP
ncbi:MAG: alpha/beta hydrolase [Rhizobiaceae bacterium]|nr:alpha/beta hydrolase [Rhizobiaceae bacterium]